MQLGFEPILREGAGSLRYLAGYSFSVPERVRPYIHGIVSTPRWVDRAAASYPWPIMLDNGAFPAWRDGVTLDPVGSMRAMRAACAKHGERVVSLIAPDIIAGGERSWRVTAHYAARMREWSQGRRIFLPVQEGQNLELVVRYAQESDCDLFVGGATHEFKCSTSEALRALWPGAYIHVGRIAADGDLYWHSSRADSFDNTSFVRAQHYNKRQPYELQLGRYCERNDNP